MPGIGQRPLALFWKCTWSSLTLFMFFLAEQERSRKIEKTEREERNFSSSAFHRHSCASGVTRSPDNDHPALDNGFVKCSHAEDEIRENFELSFPISRSTASSFEWTFVELTKIREKGKKIFQFQSQVEKKKKIFYFYLFSPLKILFRAILS